MTLKTNKMPTYKIDTYSIRLWSSRRTDKLSPGTALAGIYFYEDNKYRGYAYFYADDTPLNPPVYQNNGRIFVHYNISQFQDISNIIREEKPIYLYFHNPSNAGIQTGREPVGEEES